MCHLRRRTTAGSTALLLKITHRIDAATMQPHWCCRRLQFRCKLNALQYVHVSHAAGGSISNCVWMCVTTPLWQHHAVNAAVQIQTPFDIHPRVL
jgi:hypothetical protein